MYLFRDSDNFTTQHLTGAITNAGRILFKGRHRKIWIDIAGRALQEKTERFAFKCLLHSLCHGGREIRRVLEVVAAEDDRVTGVVHENRQRLPCRRIHSQYSYGTVNRSRRNPSFIALKPTHSSVTIDSQSVMTDQSEAVSDTDSSVGEVRACFGNRPGYFFQR